MAKKILIVTDDAGESYEILYARHRLLEAGYQPVIAATKKKLLNGVIHDFYPGWNTYIEKPGYLIQADLAIAQVKAAEYEALLLIGGRAPEFLRHNDKLQIVQEFHRSEMAFAICHGIQVLLAAGVCRGRRLTCYENVRLEVVQCGEPGSTNRAVTERSLPRKRGKSSRSFTGTFSNICSS
jgi:protease I